MINQVLLYAGGALPLIWGVAHLFPTKNVVAGFGEISVDNKRIITMELIGISVAAGSAAALSTTMGEPDTFVDRMTVMAVMIVAGCLEGVAIGFFQWRVLRQVFKELSARDWLIPTVAVAGIGWFVGMLQPTFFVGSHDAPSTPPVAEPSTLFIVLFAVAFGLIAGALFGTAQWFVLRRHAQHAWLWIPANVIGWAAALAVIYVGAAIPSETWAVGRIIWLGMITGTVAGLAIGSTTGVALLQIIQRSHPQRCIGGQER